MNEHTHTDTHTKIQENERKKSDEICVTETWI